MSCCLSDCGLLACQQPRKLLSTKRKQDDVVADSATALHPFLTSQQPQTSATTLHPFFTRQLRTTSATVAPEKPFDDIARVDTTTPETAQPRVPMVAVANETIATVAATETTSKTKKYDWLKCLFPGCLHLKFQRPARLRWHDDFIHRGIKNFVCDHIDSESNTKCGFACAEPSHLKDHKRSHSAARLFKCTECSQTCKSKKNRHDHWVAIHAAEDHPDKIKLMIKRHKCDRCPETFRKTSCLTAHRLHNHTPKDDPEYIAFMAKMNAYQNGRYASDVNLRLKAAARSSLHRMLATTGLKKCAKSEAMIGCTFKELMVHLNKNNRGLVYGDPDVDIHVDHIRPLNNFKLGCQLEMLKAVNFNNLQLLPGFENISKRDRFTPADALAYAASAGGKAIAELEIGWRAAGVCECPECVQ
ncbi:hypothetical protein T484DRAFT_1758204 [Baffinella frigidus]|nr:hypothetical protein T484DRAFT_1758204 [Cryptophyta sp. CCMP2293]